MARKYASQMRLNFSVYHDDPDGKDITTRQRPQHPAHHPLR